MNEWINAKDVLPGEDEWVLGFSPKYPVGNDMRYRILQGRFVKYADITHWQFLPPDPEVIK
jgi:hypothetical protein